MLFSKQTPAAGGTAFAQFDAAWCYDGNGYIYNDTGTSLDVRIGAAGNVQTLAAGGTLPIKLVYSLAELYVRRTDQSTTQVTVEATVGTGSAGGGGSEADVSTVMRTKGGTYYAANYGQISDTLAVSHLAIQAAIDAAAAAGGGTVMLPPQKCLMGATLIPKSGVTVRGSGCRVLAVQNAYDLGFSIDGGSILSFPGGVIFTKDDSGAYSKNDYLSNFNLEDFGVQDCATILKAGARSHAGLSGSRIQNIYGSGISGWGFDLANLQHVQLSNVMLVCVGGMHLWCDSRNADLGAGNFMSPGNSTFIDFYTYHPNTGSVWESILVENITGSDGMMGSLTFIRPQRNAFGGNAAATVAFKFSGKAGIPHPSIAVYDADIEGQMSYGVQADYMDGFDLTVAGISTGQKLGISNIVGPSAIRCYRGAPTVEIGDATSCINTQISGKFAQVGTTNLRAVGTYFDQSRSATAMIYQFAQYDNSHFKGDAFTMTVPSGNTLNIEGARIKKRIITHSGGALPEGYASDIVKLGTAGSSTAVPSSTNCATECTRYINTSAGTVTITGVTGGDITLTANGSMVDVQAISGAWYLVNKQGT